MHMRQLLNPLTKFSRSFCRMSENEVIRTEMGSTAIFTLNRPKALNSLNLNMVRIMYEHLNAWKKNDKIQHIIIEGAGDKAFCAGGDVVTLRKSGMEKDPKSCDFFYQEYLVNHAIGTFPKPFTALIDGITMGGGVGVSVHARFRVATERTLFAMPETAIGLFPDVGGGYFLPRLKGELGTFLALTGQRLKGEDVFKAGVATHFVDSEKMEKLKEALISIKDISENSIETVLNKFQADSTKLDTKKPFLLDEHSSHIDKHFRHNSVEEILAELQSSSEWCKKQASIIERMSPTSLKVTLAQLRAGANMDLAEDLKMEFRIASQCMRENSDFFEGVRAVLVDKDNSPKWNPNSLSGVSQELVESFFKPLPLDKELKI